MPQQLEAKVKGVVMISSPGPNPPQSDAMCSGRAAVHAQRARVTEQAAESLFKILHVRAQTEPGGVVGGSERGEDFRPESLMLRFEIEEGDFHGKSLAMDYTEGHG